MVAWRKVWRHPISEDMYFRGGYLGHRALSSHPTQVLTLKSHLVTKKAVGSILSEVITISTIEVYKTVKEKWVYIRTIILILKSTDSQSSSQTVVGDGSS